jgi:hypothetical protein
MMGKPGTDEVERVRMRRNKVSDLLLGKVSTVSALKPDAPLINGNVLGHMMGR